MAQSHRRSSPRPIVVEAVLSNYLPTRISRIEGEKHLVAVDGKGRGIFIAASKHSCVDRKTVREIAVERNRHGLTKISVYGRTCLFSAPSLNFVQIGLRGQILGY